MYYKEDLEQGWLNLYTILIVMLLQVFFLAYYFMASICNVELSQNVIIWYSLLLFGCLMEFINIILHSTDSSIPNSRHIWMSFGGAVLVGGSLVRLSLILSRIEKKLSARGQLDGRIKRDLIMAKIPLVSWAVLTFLSIVVDVFNAKIDGGRIIEADGLFNLGPEPSALRGFLHEFSMIATKLCIVLGVSFFFSVSGTYGSCFGVGVGLVLRVWRLVTSLIAVPWKSGWIPVEVYSQGKHRRSESYNLWANVVIAQRHDATTLLWLLFVFNFAWSIFRVTSEFLALEGESQANADGDKKD